MSPQTHPVRWSFGANRPVIRSFFSQVGKSFLIYPASFLTATALVSSNLALIFYARTSFGFSPALVGWFAACYSIFYFVGCIALRPIGRHLLPRQHVEQRRIRLLQHRQQVPLGILAMLGIERDQRIGGLDA